MRFDMEETTKHETWRYTLINGQKNTIEVLNPKTEKGVLTSIKDARPIIKKDKNGNKVDPTVDFVETEKRKIYREFFKKPFKNFLVLSGAGSSMDAKGKSMLQLWDIAEKKYHFEETEESGLISDFKTICEAIRFEYECKDLEALLSQIEGTIKFSGDSEIKLYNEVKKELSVIKGDIFKIIVEECTIQTPSTENFPHKTFLEKILQRKQTSPRVKIFTLNYDTLFEDAARASNAIVIDGFSFTLPRTFSGRFFDYDIVQREGSKLKEEDNFVQRVLHLHKLHGSINWTRLESTNEVIVESNPANPLMVYPRESKYEDSYDQPFFEMMARFQRNLRLNNDTLLICIGYSFNDKHINAAIEEALNQNPGFRLAVIDPGFDNSDVKAMQSIKNQALKSDRILMVAETFSDFANSFPEIQTYESTSPDVINLRNE
jgi:hypothetical protein